MRSEIKFISCELGVIRPKCISPGRQTYKHVGAISGRRRERGSVACTAQLPGVSKYLSQHSGVVALQ
jgi:hypothetical protein